MLPTGQRYAPPIVIMRSLCGSKVVSKLSKSSTKNVSKLSQSSPKQVVSKLCQSCVKVVAKFVQSFVKAVSKLSQSCFKVCQSCLKVVSKLTQSCLQVAPNLFQVVPNWCPKLKLKVCPCSFKWCQVVSKLSKVVHKCCLFSSKVVPSGLHLCYQIIYRSLDYFIPSFPCFCGLIT